QPTPGDGPSGSGRLTAAPPDPLRLRLRDRPSASAPLRPEPTVDASTLLVAALALAGCARVREPQLFERLPPERTGVTFANRLPDDTTFDILAYLYYYDGGGVAVGDVNNDGLPDLYFTSNVGPNRLYLNKGNYRFEDVTERAGVADSGPWKTGVNGRRPPGVGDRLCRTAGGHFVDVSGRAGLYGGAPRYGLGVVASDLNGDGCPDLYVANDFQEDDFLYINNCDGTFTESGATA